jgi:hypothetical protein
MVVLILPGNTDNDDATVVNAIRDCEASVADVETLG